MCTKKSNILILIDLSSVPSLFVGFYFVFTLVDSMFSTASQRDDFSKEKKVFSLVSLWLAHPIKSGLVALTKQTYIEL